MLGLSEPASPKVEQLSENLNKQLMRKRRLCESGIQWKEMRNVRAMSSLQYSERKYEVTQKLQRSLLHVKLLFFFDQICCVDLSLNWKMLTFHEQFFFIYISGLFLSISICVLVIKYVNGYFWEQNLTN